MTDPAPLTPPRSQGRDIWHQFKRHRGAMAGAVMFVLIVAAVLLGPLIWSIDPSFIDILARDQGPSLAHPMGTDQLGRDTLARVLAGGQTSIAVGLVAMALALVLGSLIGVLAGMFKWLDAPLMRLTDLFLSLPLLPLLLVMVMLFREALSDRFGPEAGIFALIVVAIGITSWMPTARIVRGDVLALKEREFRARCPFDRHHQHRTDHPPYPAQRAVADHGLGHAGHRQCHHHRKRAQLSGTGLSTGFPDLGEAAERCDGVLAGFPRAGDLARTGDFPDGAGGQLHGRRAARRARPAGAPPLRRKRTAFQRGWLDLTRSDLPPGPIRAIVPASAATLE